MKKKKILFIVIAIIACAAVAAVVWNPFAAPKIDETEEEEEVLAPAGPAFNADSAYAFVKAQCDFGTRDMNSEGHERCAKWIIEKFKSYGCEVKTQQANLKGYDGTMLRSTNIMASFNPKATTRIMLCAHWDSRPWADNDPDSANWHKPILAANDAASGVAVMLEIARLLGRFCLLRCRGLGNTAMEQNARRRLFMGVGCTVFCCQPATGICSPLRHFVRHGRRARCKVLSGRHVKTVCS